jgi:hypothetical protein
MCGIAGMFDSVGRRDIDRALLERMTGRIAHRGPDGEGFHVEPGVGLGHRRLSIIDLAGGRQPIYNEDGSVAITFNGEIYNFLGLRDELEQAGHRFQTRSDTRRSCTPGSSGASAASIVSAGCSPSCFGIATRRPFFSRATVSARSRCTTPSSTTACCSSRRS